MAFIVVAVTGTARTRDARAGEASTSGEASLAHQVETGLDDFRISVTGSDGVTQLDAFSPDAASNPRTGELLVVWRSDDLRDGEFEIFGQRIRAVSGAPVGSAFRISDMGPDFDTSFQATDPAVAYNSRDNEYLVVWSGDDDTAPLVDDESEVFGQRIAADGSPIGDNDFRISDMGPDGDPGFDALVPAVVYNWTDDEYLVVWKGDAASGDFEVFGQRLGTDGSEKGTNDFRISDVGPDGNTGFTVADPDVAHDSRNNEYLVVWWGDDDTAPLADDELEIFGQRIDAAGSEIGDDDFRISDMGADGDTGFRAETPAVAYGSRNDEYLVVWAGNDQGTGAFAELEIFGQRIDTTGAETGANDFRISDMGPDGDPRFEAFAPAVAYSAADHEYLVSWAGDDDRGALVDDELEIFGQQIDSEGGEVGANDFRVSSMGLDGHSQFPAGDPAIASDPGSEAWLVVWDGQEAPGETEIYGQMLDAFALELFLGAIGSERSSPGFVDRAHLVDPIALRSGPEATRRRPGAPAAVGRRPTR